MHAGADRRDAGGRKELIGFQVGVRERAQSWRELLIDVKQRGLQIASEIAVGDGALGFWKALGDVFPGTRHQRCWVHKTVNVLDKVPLSVQATMKKDLREVYWAPSRASAEAAIDVFAEKYRAKYGGAVECLVKDRDALLAFYDFPAEHWITCAPRMRWTSDFFMAEATIAEIAVVHSFVRSRCGPFFRPGHRSRSRRAQGRSRLAAFAATARLGLARPKHGMLAWIGTAFLAGTCRQPRLWFWERGIPRGEA